MLDLKDDAVHAAWGGSWRMPRTDEIAKLSAAVTTEFVKNYNNSEVNGLLCTATDGSNKTLFFPACSKAMNETVVDIGIKGSYWYSSLNSGNVSQAYGLYFRNSSPNWQSPYYRDAGLAVRGVLGEI